MAHRIPGHLLEGSQTWLTGLRDAREWSATEWRLLLLAAEAWDRSQTARRTLTREGLTFEAPIFDKRGDVVATRITAHPAVAIAERNAALFSKLVAQLGLDVPALSAEEPEKPDDKPGGILHLLQQRTA